MGFPLDLALRHLRAKKRAFASAGTAFAVIGVALGVAALTTVMSVTGGFRAEFRRKVLGVNAHVLVLKSSTDFREYRDVMQTLKDTPGVIGIAPFIINPMMVTHGERTQTGVLVKGIDPALVNDVLDLPKDIVAGSLDGLRRPGAKPAERRRAPFVPAPIPAQPAPGGSADTAKTPPKGAERRASFLDNLEEVLDEAERGIIRTPPPPVEPEPALPDDAPEGNTTPEGGFEGELPEDDALPTAVDPDPCAPGTNTVLPGIVVGVTLKKTLHIELGDCIHVTSPTIGFSYSQGSIYAPVRRQFRVIGVFDAGFDQYDSKLVYTDLYEAQTFYDSGDSVTGVEMKVDDIDSASTIAERVAKRLGNHLYRTMDWNELNRGLFTALQIQQILMSLVLALIIIVAAFTVLATLIMVVLDKKKEIAALKAMGATDSGLLRAFVYHGTFIGVAGTIVGLGLGYGVCRGLLRYAFPLDPKVYFISHLPVQVRPGEFALVGGFAILVCLVSTVWPAMFAARLRPADAFREQR